MAWLIAPLPWQGCDPRRGFTWPTKQRIYSANKCPYSKGYGLPSGHLYGCESWIIKKPECQRIDSFKLWCWKRLLRDLWRSNQSILMESTLNTQWKDWCLSWSSRILVTWFEPLTHWKSPWCWERLRVEGEDGIRGWEGWMASQMQWTWTWANFGRWWRTGRPVVLQSMGSQRVRHNWATQQQQQWKAQSASKLSVECIVMLS